MLYIFFQVNYGWLGFSILLQINNELPTIRRLEGHSSSRRNSSGHSKIGGHAPIHYFYSFPTLAAHSTATNNDLSNLPFSFLPFYKIEHKIDILFLDSEVYVFLTFIILRRLNGRKKLLNFCQSINEIYVYYWVLYNYKKYTKFDQLICTRQIFICS